MEKMIVTLCRPMALLLIASGIISCTTKDMTKERTETTDAQAVENQSVVEVTPLKIKGGHSDVRSSQVLIQGSSDLGENEGVVRAEQTTVQKQVPSSAEPLLYTGQKKSFEPNAINMPQSKGESSLNQNVIQGVIATVSPTELYSSENVLTFTAAGGIKSIEPLFDPVTVSLTSVTGVGTFSDCSTERTVRITVNTASHALGVRFKVTDCKDRANILVLSNRTWRLDEVPFPDMEVGDTACRPFQIGLQGIGSIASEYLDSITLGHPQAFIRYQKEPPLRITAGQTYRYNVCFVPRRPGLYRFPVITWIRRGQPAGGYTSYPVADTAVVRVNGRNLK